MKAANFTYEQFFFKLYYWTGPDPCTSLHQCTCRHTSPVSLTSPEWRAIPAETPVGFLQPTCCTAQWRTIRCVRCVRTPSGKYVNFSCVISQEFFNNPSSTGVLRRLISSKLFGRHEVTRMPMRKGSRLVLALQYYTRKLSYRKDDRAMRPIYGCPGKFRESWLAHGYLSGNF